MDAQQHLIKLINDAAHPLPSSNYDILLNAIGDARFVLIGEASHGTEEFYQTRIDITKQLIQKKGFMAVTIEGDWPDVHRIHRYIQGQTQDSYKSVLNVFQRFPRWMWANTTIP